LSVETTQGRREVGIAKKKVEKREAAAPPPTTVGRRATATLPPLARMRENREKERALICFVMEKREKNQ